MSDKVGIGHCYLSAARCSLFTYGPNHATPNPKTIISFLIETQNDCIFVVRRQRRYCCGQLQRFLPNPNALVAASKGMRAVNLCTNKISHFLTGGAGYGAG